MKAGEDSIVNVPNSPRANDIDEARKRNIAYEYLCHLEEAKIWMEAVLNEELPATTTLEDSLRNGVHLAKLGHFIAPDIVPLSKIYDAELRRYKIAGLQFRHTDNINYWLKALTASGLPKTFHPETTDVYDKKGMPKVIYCLHALSTHLFKLGRAPLVQDLYGKIKFTETEITNMKQNLDDNGISMPAFQKIFGLLSESSADVKVMYDSLMEINNALDIQDTNLLLSALQNSAAKILFVEVRYVEYYWNTLKNAKDAKIKAALNKSNDESYIPDEYDELLTQAEIQGHIISVNVACSRIEIIAAAKAKDQEKVFTILNCPWLELKDVNIKNGSFYIPEILRREKELIGHGTLNTHKDIQRAVYEGNKKANIEEEVSIKLRKIEECLHSRTSNHNDLLLLLKSNVLDLQIEDFASPLYFEELKADLEETGNLVYEELKAGLQTLNVIASITKAVETGDPDKTWKALESPRIPFSDLDSRNKVRYWQMLLDTHHSKLSGNSSCPILTYFDIQNCIDSVNQHYENSSQVIQAVHSVNHAVRIRDSKGLINALQSPALGLSDTISSADSMICLSMLEHRFKQKQIEGTELWLEDIQEGMKDVLADVLESQEVCTYVSQINSALENEDEDFAYQVLLNAGLKIKDIPKHQCYSILHRYRIKKMINAKCPWFSYQTRKGNKVFLNPSTCDYSWSKPEIFSGDCYYLTLNDIEKIITKIHKGKKVYICEKTITYLQSRIRGYLVRKSLVKKKQEKSAVVIQAWWRGVMQRQIYETIKEQVKLRKSLQYDDILKHYKKDVDKVIKIQSIWRGRQARKAFISLFHHAEPSFKVIKQFAPYLNVNKDDYIKELNLQSLKAQVTQAIRHNQQLAKQLDTMDIKIGLLVQNRISLQDVILHGKNLNDLTLKNSSEMLGVKGLKSLTKDSRKRLEGYQHLFYMLQTCPNYLAKLLFCLPKDKTTMFIKTVIWSLFNFGTNSREECLLLRLFRSALQEEVRLKFTQPSDLITSAPLVLNMVADYARQAIGPKSLQNMIGPLVQKVLGDKTLVINTNPVDIYKTWRNQEEMKQGVVSELPPSVSPEQALSYPEVQKRLAESLNALQTLTAYFLKHITESINLIPYGLLYIARVLHEALEDKFPSVPEKDILKVVGNLIYYHYINPAIIGPETYGIITLTADNSLSNTQRLNLASIAKILQFAAVKKGFGEESRHLMCLNNFIIECHKKFKMFFKKCCDVEDLDSHFSLHQYSEATLISKPVIYVTLQEICDTHRLLMEYLDHIAPDPMDPLAELLDDMGPPPTIATLTGRSPSDSSLSNLAKTEVCLMLVNKFELPEDDDTDVHKLFIKAKEILLCLLPCLHGENLLETLAAPETGDQEALFAELMQNRAESHSNHPQKMMYTTFCINENSLKNCKNLLRQYLVKLELEGLISQDDNYQTIISVIARDICNHGKYRETMRKEIHTLQHAKHCLSEKTKFYEEQVALYMQYIEKCLENLNAGKRNVHSLKNFNHRRKVKSRMVLKYTAARLHDKGVLIEVDGLPPSQFKNMQFEIAPADVNGIFTVCGRFMGVNLEKVDIDIQHLLELQFEGESVMDIFGKAKINVNLLLFLLNKKFYGKN